MIMKKMAQMVETTTPFSAVCGTIPFTIMYPEVASTELAGVQMSLSSRGTQCVGWFMVIYTCKQKDSIRDKTDTPNHSLLA